MVVLLFLIYFFVVVNSLSLQGPEYTRYDPCNLGIIYFDRIGTTGMGWRGVINFRLYPNISDAQIELVFDKPMTIAWASQNTTIYARKNWTDFLMKPSGDLPPHYLFYLTEKYNLTSTNVPTVKTVKLNSLTLCNDSVKKHESIEYLNATQPEDTNYRQVCGRRALRNAELTSVKTEAKAGDWPWHVAVLIRDIPNYGHYKCGGNIVSRTAVLTAGHCVFYNDIRIETSRIVVEAGVDDLPDVNQIGRQILPAVDVVVHPSFSPYEATADLAIIRVNHFNFTAFVQPICIWGPTYSKQTLYGVTGVVVGFGTTEENELSDRLRSTYTVVQNDTTCIKYSPELYTDLLNEFTFCAGLNPRSGVSPLKGDSGGGLAIATLQPDHKVSWFLRGVLSKCGVPVGEVNCDPQYYVIYTDVAPHYGWIFHNAGLNYVSNIVE